MRFKSRHYYLDLFDKEDIIKNKDTIFKDYEIRELIDDKINLNKLKPIPLDLIYAKSKKKEKGCVIKNNNEIFCGIIKGDYYSLKIGNKKIQYKEIYPIEILNEINFKIKQEDGTIKYVDFTQYRDKYIYDEKKSYSNTCTIKHDLKDIQNIKNQHGLDIMCKSIEYSSKNKVELSFSTTTHYNLITPIIEGECDKVTSSLNAKFHKSSKNKKMVSFHTTSFILFHLSFGR